MCDDRLRRILRICASVAIVLATVATAAAQTASATESAKPAQAPEKRPSTFDKIWKFADRYDNKSNPVIQRVLFSGRYQHDFTSVHADQGELDEWNVRRMRLTRPGTVTNGPQRRRGAE